MYRLRHAWAGWVALSLGLVIGCSGDQKKLINGIVLFDGQPLANGGVTFEPAEPKGNPTACSVADGKFTVYIVPAKYKITVKSEVERESVGVRSYNDGKGFNMAEAMKAAQTKNKAEGNKLAAKVAGEQNIPPNAPGNDITLEVKANQDITLSIRKPKQ